MVASFPLEGVDVYMLLLFESGRSHPDVGTKVVQSYLYNKYTIHCILYIGYSISRVQYTERIHDTGYNDNL